jgi:hypothetical protein
MDDTKDKIRRNVVACAALIILIPFWGLNTKNFRLWGLEIQDTVSPIKVWMTITAVLLYFFLRYLFHSDTIKLNKELQAELTAMKRDFITPMLEADIESYVRTSKKTKYITNPESYMEGRMDEEFNANRNAIQKIKVTGYIVHDAPSLWANTVGFSVEGIHKSRGSFGWTGGSVCNYRIPRLKIGFVFTESIVKLAAYSAIGINFVFPFVLFYCAWGYCWFQLSSILWVG